ncbi:hypothetical protein RND71_015613 [Anisodus tanguticus]|uniref:Uncharacterized protein n=1 Tax=Anisodus tanguticus TaxID=243964 RepID=A0AAE1VL92_9SOLA|nr:hypothetical protein RND71_015613 [Anisodus tanguticus]
MVRTHIERILNTERENINAILRVLIPENHEGTTGRSLTLKSSKVEDEDEMELITRNFRKPNRTILTERKIIGSSAHHERNQTKVCKRGKPQNPSDSRLIPLSPSINPAPTALSPDNHGLNDSRRRLGALPEEALTFILFSFYQRNSIQRCRSEHLKFMSQMPEALKIKIADMNPYVVITCRTQEKKTSTASAIQKLKSHSPQNGEIPKPFQFSTRTTTNNLSYGKYRTTRQISPKTADFLGNRTTHRRMP